MDIFIGIHNPLRFSGTVFQQRIRYANAAAMVCLSCIIFQFDDQPGFAVLYFRHWLGETLPYRIQVEFFACCSNSGCDEQCEFVVDVFEYYPLISSLLASLGELHVSAFRFIDER